MTIDIASFCWKVSAGSSSPSPPSPPLAAAG